MNKSTNLTTKVLAALLGCSEGQLSESTRKQWKVKGHEAWEWAVFDDNGRVVGYAVPTEVFEELVSARNAPPESAHGAGDGATTAALPRPAGRIRARRPPSNSSVPAAPPHAPSHDDARFERYFEEYERRLQHACDTYEARIERLRDELDALTRREREAKDDAVRLAMQHQTELQRLYADHQREAAALKDEVRELKADLRIAQADLGETPAWERILQTDAVQNFVGGLGLFMQQLAAPAPGHLLDEGEGTEWEDGADDAFPQQPMPSAPAAPEPAQPGPTHTARPNPPAGAPASAASALLGELAALLASEDGEAFAERVMAAVQRREVPINGWPQVGSSILGHVLNAGWDAERLAYFALPLLDQLPDPYRAFPPAQLVELAQQFIPMSKTEAALLLASLKIVAGK